MIVTRIAMGLAALALLGVGVAVSNELIMHRMPHESFVLNVVVSVTVFGVAFAGAVCLAARALVGIGGQGGGA